MKLFNMGDVERIWSWISDRQPVQIQFMFVDVVVGKTRDSDVYTRYGRI